MLCHCANPLLGVVTLDLAYGQESTEGIEQVLIE